MAAPRPALRAEAHPGRLPGPRSPHGPRPAARAGSGRRRGRAGRARRPPPVLGPFTPWLSLWPCPWAPRPRSPPAAGSPFAPRRVHRARPGSEAGRGRGRWRVFLPPRQGAEHFPHLWGAGGVPARSGQKGRAGQPREGAELAPPSPEGSSGAASIHPAPCVRLGPGAASADLRLPGGRRVTCPLPSSSASRGQRAGPGSPRGNRGPRAPPRSPAPCSPAGPQRPLRAQGSRRPASSGALPSKLKARLGGTGEPRGTGRSSSAPRAPPGR